MGFKIGDMVKVVKDTSETDAFVALSVGVVAPIVQIWEGEEYPYELEGFYECLCEEELELVAGGTE